MWNGGVIVRHDDLPDGHLGGGMGGRPFPPDCWPSVDHGRAGGGLNERLAKGPSEDKSSAGRHHSSNLCYQCVPATVTVILLAASSQGSSSFERPDALMVALVTLWIIMPL